MSVLQTASTQNIKYPNLYYILIFHLRWR